MTLPGFICLIATGLATTGCAIENWPMTVYFSLMSIYWALMAQSERMRK